MNNPLPPGQAEQHQRRMGLLAGGIAMALAGLMSITIVDGSLPAVAVLALPFILVVTLTLGLALAGRGREQAAAARPPELQVLPQRGDLERLLLSVAAEHDGYVTPEAVVLRAKGVTLREARELLDDLVISGDCEMDADDEGHCHYRFRTSVAPARDTLSAEEWVSRSAGRMAGSSGTTEDRLDA